MKRQVSPTAIRRAAEGKSIITMLVVILATVLLLIDFVYRLQVDKKVNARTTMQQELKPLPPLTLSDSEKSKLVELYSRFVKEDGEENTDALLQGVLESSETQLVLNDTVVSLKAVISRPDSGGKNVSYALLQLSDRETQGVEIISVNDGEVVRGYTIKIVSETRVDLFGSSGLNQENASTPNQYSLYMYTQRNNQKST